MNTANVLSRRAAAYEVTSTCLRRARRAKICKTMKLWATITGLFFLLVWAVRYACILGLFCWACNSLFGLKMGDLPAIWQVGLTFVIGLAVCQGILYLRRWSEKTKTQV